MRESECVSPASPVSTTPKQALYDIAQRYGIDLIYAFGSQADAVRSYVFEETPPTVNRPGSDADIGVVFHGSLPPEGIVRAKVYSSLYIALSDALEPFRVDLCFLQENHSVFQAQAIKGCCLYAVNEEIKDNYEEMIMRRAADFRPFLDRFLAEALEEVGSGVSRVQEGRNYD